MDKPFRIDVEKVRAHAREQIAAFGVGRMHP